MDMKNYFSRILPSLGLNIVVLVVITDLHRGAGI
jgi:hypothetical protein